MNFLAKYGNILVSIICLMLWMVYDIVNHFWGIVDPGLLLLLKLSTGGGLGHFIKSRSVQAPAYFTSGYAQSMQPVSSSAEIKGQP